MQHELSAGDASAGHVLSTSLLDDTFRYTEVLSLVSPTETTDHPFNSCDDETNSATIFAKWRVNRY